MHLSLPLSLLLRSRRRPLWLLSLALLCLPGVSSADTLAAALTRTAASQQTGNAISPTHPAMVIDGRFDEPQWQQAQQFNTFYQVVPASRSAHQDKAQAKVFANADGVYVAITNFQAKGQRQKQYNLQDAFMQADFNNIIVDFAGDGSAAYLFSMTLGGGIQDSAMTPQLETDEDWDGIWQVAHAETDDFWTSEFFLPWQSVSFRQRVQADGLSNIAVSVQLYDLAKNHVYGSQPQSLAHSDFYLGMPTLSADIPAQAHWQFLPYLTTQYDAISGQNKTDAGLDLLYKPAHHQQISLAVNPDFGQVDSDELVLNYSNVETLYTDKRPFFTQDLSLFSTLSLQDSQMLHTRRIGAGSDDGSTFITPIDAAVRATHQGESVNFGAFAVQEDSLASGAGKAFYAARTTWRNQQWQSGLLATRTERPGLQRTAETLTWDSQYQSNTWSWQTALSRSDIQQGHANPSTADNPDNQGVALLAAGKYQFTPRFDLGIELLRLDDSFDNNDLGYMQRNNWRDLALLGSYATSPEIAGLSRLKHKFRLSYQTDDAGLKLAAKQDYLMALLLDNGAQTELQLVYQTAGWQDNIGYGSDAFALPSAWSQRLLYISPYVGQLTWAASVQLDDQGFDGLARQFGLDLTWLPHANWTLNFNNFFREGDGWLIANRINQISSYDSELFATNIKAAGLLTDQLEFGLHLQWALLDARSEQVWQIRQRQLQPFGQITTDTSFEDRRLTAQFKLRYKLGAYSDFYLVYNRGGELFTAERQQQAWLPAIADLWQAPGQSLWTAKVRYAF